MAGNGLIGLRVIFSSKAVDLGRKPDRSMPADSRGSVSERFILVFVFIALEPSVVKPVTECFRVVVGGDGMRVDGSCRDGNLMCDFEVVIPVFLRARVGSGKLLNVRLLGMPPIGSSGRQM